jgi:hypothetical protein
MAYGEIGSGSLKITDNYNNSFTVTATPGTSGVGNPVTKSSLWISQTKDSSGKWVWGSAIAGGTGSFSRTISLDVTTADTKAVGAYLRTYATYGENKDLQETANIRQYVAPKMSGQPYIVQYALGDRLTADVSWNWTWEAAKPANDSSPVRGYRIRLYKNGSLVTGLSVNKSTDGSHYLVKGNGTNEYIDYEGHDNTNLNTHKRLTIANPAGTFGFKAGDTVKLGLFAYSKNGLGEIQWSAGGQWNNLFSGNATSQTNSSIYTIENKGIMNVKVGGSWKEGQVYVKVGGAWKEAQGVYTKVNGSWKEST